MIINVDQAGRVLIPVLMRRMLGIEPGDEIKIEIKDKKIIIIKIESKSE